MKTNTNFSCRIALVFFQIVCINWNIPVRLPVNQSNQLYIDINIENSLVHSAVCAKIVSVFRSNLIFVSMKLPQSVLDCCCCWPLTGRLIRKHCIFGHLKKKNEMNRTKVVRKLSGLFSLLWVCINCIWCNVDGAQAYVMHIVWNRHTIADTFSFSQANKINLVPRNGPVWIIDKFMLDSIESFWMRIKPWLNWDCYCCNVWRMHICATIDLR